MWLAHTHFPGRRLVSFVVCCRPSWVWIAHALSAFFFWTDPLMYVRRLVVSLVECCRPSWVWFAHALSVVFFWSVPLTYVVFACPLLTSYLCSVLALLPFLSCPWELEFRKGCYGPVRRIYCLSSFCSLLPLVYVRPYGFCMACPRLVRWCRWCKCLPRMWIAHTLSRAYRGLSLGWCCRPAWVWIAHALPLFFP